MKENKAKAIMQKAAYKAFIENFPEYKKENILVYEAYDFKKRNTFFVNKKTQMNDKLLKESGFVPEETFIKLICKIRHECQQAYF